MNNDGKDDTIVGAPAETVGSNNYQGRVYVFDGPTGDLIHTLTTKNPQATLASYFGSSVSSGDVNNDGKDDIIVGAPYEDVGSNADQGRVYVFDGSTRNLIHNLTTPNSQ